jgi:hypothetical protein
VTKRYIEEASVFGEELVWCWLWLREVIGEWAGLDMNWNWLAGTRDTLTPLYVENW